MATRRNAGAAGMVDENPPVAAAQRGEHDVNVAHCTGGRIYVVKEQTVQLVKFHPVTVRVGMELELPPGATCEDAQGLMDEAAYTVTQRLNTELRAHLEAGLEILDQMGLKPVT